MKPSDALAQALLGRRIIVQVKHAYGERRIYPVCEAAQQFAEIAGTKTLTLRNINAIRALGYVIDNLPEEI